MAIDIDGMLKYLLETAKTHRSQQPYTIKDDDAGIPTMVIVIGPDGENAVLPMTWADEREKYAKMRAVAQVAKHTFAQAVAMVSDMRWTKSDKFSEHFKIPKPDATIEGDIERYKKDYHRILDDHGGLVKNLPRSVWSDGLVAVIKGPRIGTRSRIVYYEQGPNDEVKFTREPEKSDKDQFDLLPAWWQ